MSLDVIHIHNEDKDEIKDEIYDKDKDEIKAKDKDEYCEYMRKMSNAEQESLSDADAWKV